MIPGSANPLLLATAAAGGYSISRSVRFNSSDSAFCGRTVSSAGDRRTFTFSAWVKRSVLGTVQSLFSVVNGATQERLMFNTDNKLYWVYAQGTSARNTDAVYRDVSAWYHIVWVSDTNNGTATERIRFYVNGVQQLTSGDTVSSGQQWDVNNTVAHRIGNFNDGGSDSLFFNGYLADIHFIDGQALDPTSFGEFSATTGVWMPKAYTGTYGTNGFKLNFSDNSTAAALGTDTSGNGNTWTVNNLSVTAGAGNDSVVDVPTNGSEVDTGSGGQVRGNYCTINPLDQRFTDNGTISNGNLDYAQSSTGSRTARCTIGVSSGKWYWEFTHLGGNASHGISKSTSSLASYPGGADADGWSWFAGGNMYNNGGSVSTYSGLTYTTNDVIGVALNLDAGTLTYYKNGVSQGTAVSGLAGTWFPSFGSSSVAVVSFTANFGQRPFAYTAPSGFKALCTANLPAPVVTKPSTVMDVLLWTGNGSTQTISGLSFEPDMVWLKRRSATANNRIYDQIRGATKSIYTDLTDAEGTESTGLTAFTSTGFSLGNQAGHNSLNGTFVGWCWDAGSSTVTNTQGSITSSVRANATAGFSIVTYTGTGANASVGHGLGVAPSLIIIKARTQAVARHWAVYHASIGATRILELSTTNAAQTVNFWQDTAPTSTVFTLSNQGDVNASTYNYVAYCFAPVAGYSSFGSYTGNGSSDGPFVYTGFRPRWVMIKSTNSAGNWEMLDSARDTYNPEGSLLRANSSGAEIAASPMNDFLSNGFKARSVNGNQNDSGITYIYFAVAESPFAYSRAR